MADEKDKHDSPANPDNQISLERQAADAAHEAKLTGDIPERKAPDRPQARAKKGRHGVALKETPSTGHEWDGIKEYDNPLPRWWLWTFYICIIWAVGYMFAYPAIPLVNGSTQGFLGYSNRKDVAAEIERVAAANAPIESRIVAADINDIPKDPELYNFSLNAGRAVFGTWCVQCHGSGAAGAKGYPNLLDNVWLWGGTLEDIELTLRHGIRDPHDDDTRYSEMPRFGADGILDRTGIAQVSHYVLSLSDLPHDAALAGPGAEVFADNCTACHGEDAKGDRAQGAPDLTDSVWQYFDGNRPDPQALAQLIHDGPFGVMPAWSGRLSDAQIREVAVYVHSLGGGE